MYNKHDQNSRVYSPIAPPIHINPPRTRFCCLNRSKSPLTSILLASISAVSPALALSSRAKILLFTVGIMYSEVNGRILRHPTTAPMKPPRLTG